MCQRRGTQSPCCALEFQLALMSLLSEGFGHFATPGDAFPLHSHKSSEKDPLNNCSGTLGTAVLCPRKWQPAEAPPLSLQVLK